MLLIFKNGEFHYSDIGNNARGRINSSGRPFHIDITPTDIVVAVKNMRDITEYAQYLRYFLAHLFPAVKGDIICYFDRKRQLMNTVTQVEYITRLVLEEFYGYKEAKKKFNFIY
ncbi:hypothetical protein LCGC14_3100110 [marine sediment metagenome]|uniref:Uncharacterized protein n=1 Tax=marine sediment metagenome TaxID=412755 RepID=A0A0F8W8H5_9ZZZZ